MSCAYSGGTLSEAINHDNDISKQLQSLPKPYVQNDILVRNNMYANEHEILSIQHYTYSQVQEQHFFLAVPHFTVTVTQSVTEYASVLFMYTLPDS